MTSTPPTHEASTPTKKTYDLSLTSDLIEVVQLEDHNLKKSLFADHILKIVKKYGIENYEIILLFDEHDSISTYHSNRIYSSISNLNKERDILLFLLSNGGKIEPAYLISKTCVKLKKDKFVVTVPRRAKSAATLIALGANEIHMGPLSELGPIDPQLDGLPALGISNALERLAKLVSEHPGSAEMFAKYLTANLNLRVLGYFERINESAAQYAERLLSGKKFPDKKSPKDMAGHFTNHYKDHGFLIDAEEATTLLGTDIIKQNEKEYNFGNELYEFLDFADFISRIFPEKRIIYVGGILDGFDQKALDSKKN